mmetsp:Transcript_22119/g.73389  ORF Transcript_22119/g.73389 Transcript_22119/m.73389 type:complete len:250 (-) Transcript_22119:216-965(-)
MPLDVGGCSPGPIYRPNLKFAGKGPNGRGPEFSIPPRTFHVRIQEKKTTQDSAPGPKYTTPQSVGRQVESTFRQQPIVRFSTSKRITMGALPTSTGDVGPGAYDHEGKEVQRRKLKDQANVALHKKGWGGAPRFYSDRVVKQPGPGQYTLPPSIGGKNPQLKSAPTHVIGTGERSGRKHLAQMGRDTPGPAYAIGRQGLKKEPVASFGTAARWKPSDLTVEDKVLHQSCIIAAKKRALEATAALESATV